MQCVVVCCRALWCVAVCCCVLQCVSVCCRQRLTRYGIYDKEMRLCHPQLERAQHQKKKMTFHVWVACVFERKWKSETSDSYAWHYSSICVTWRIQTSDLTHWYVWYVWFERSLAKNAGAGVTYACVSNMCAHTHNARITHACTHTCNDTHTHARRCRLMTRTHACIISTHSFMHARKLHARTLAHTHLRTHACMHAHTHACMQARTHARKYTHTYARNHTRTHAHARTHA